MRIKCNNALPFEKFPRVIFVISVTSLYRKYDQSRFKSYLNLSRVLLKNDQIYFKNLAVFTRLYNKSAKVKQIIKKLLVLYISPTQIFWNFPTKLWFTKLWLT